MQQASLNSDQLTKACSKRQKIFNTLDQTGWAGLLAKGWQVFWMRFAGLSLTGRLATWLATWFTPPYFECRHLARYNSQGYISIQATLYHAALSLGNHIFIDDRVLIYQDEAGGAVVLADRVRILRDTILQTGHGGQIQIGEQTCIQPRCQFSAYIAPISIGSQVQIAPHCAFYSYNHAIVAGQPIMAQPLETKGGIVIEDDVWLGYGVIVLDGVRIGRGAVVAAGAVVTHDIPANAIAAGVPARVLTYRPERSPDSNDRMD